MRPPYRFSSWAFDDPENIHLWFDENAQLKDYRIPPGFTIRLFRGSTEIAAYVELHRTVFEFDQHDRGMAQPYLASPGIQIQLDLVTVAGDGRLAAFSASAGCTRFPGNHPLGKSNLSAATPISAGMPWVALY